MKTVLVTGCRGQLGIAVQNLLGTEKDYHLLCTDVGELDITDVREVTDFFEENRPYAVVNCAAFTAVDAAEEHEDEAFLINAIGPRNLAIAAKKTGAKLVHISTDYVFPGTEEKPRTEFDATGPVSAYGRTKLEGEKFVTAFCDRYFILRTAWLYGEGKNFVRTMLSLSETREEISVVSDQFGSPTSADALAEAIAYLLPGENYGIFHATCEGSTSWYEFTKEIFRLTGKTTKVHPVTSAEYQALNPASATRPAFSILDNRMFRLTTDFSFPHWKGALAAYLQKEGAPGV